MKTRVLASAIASLVTIGALAQSPAAKKNIDNLCGCFHVEFKYAETFSPDTSYKYHDRDAIAGGTEWVFPVETSDKKVVIQHLLIITDSMIIKHWREDWTYENPVLWNYKGDNVWEKQALKPEDTKGKWTQTVWEVSDAPRYQGSSEWITTDHRTFWQNTVDAPLPRREYSVRHDYNILRRTNRVVLTDKGYVEEQDNQKIIRKEGVDKVLVQEKGLNTYVRIEPSKCAAGQAYWEKTQDYWAHVRLGWDDFLKTHGRLELKATLDGRPMYEFLFDMAKDYAAGKLKLSDADAKVKDLLDKFSSPDKTVAATTK